MNSSIRNLFLRYVAQTSPQPDGFEVKRGEGIYLFDSQDQSYVDCISGISVSSFGHHHPSIQKAIRDQLELHLHTMVYGEHIQLPQVRLAELLARLLPANLDCTYFTNSGAEAVEGALKLARRYTGRHEIIACRKAYHGSTAGAESLRSDLAYTASARPLVPGIRHIDFNSFEDLDQITEYTAAVILEPIQGEAGVILPNQHYLQEVKKRCQATGTLMILDEIQTGMGRTGSFCAFQQEQIVPDILLLAKAFGGGLPLGAFISSHAIMQTLSHNPILGHLTTFGGHPLSCAASIAAIEILDQEDLTKKIKELGDYFIQHLSTHAAVQEIRGRGLMLALELKENYSIMEMVHACRKHGLLVDWFLFNDKSIRFYPPLITTREEAESICVKVKSALAEIG